MNKKEEYIFMVKCQELKDCRKELELYKIALKLACKDNIFPYRNINYLSSLEKEKLRSVRDLYINAAKEKKGYEL